VDTTAFSAIGYVTNVTAPRTDGGSAGPEAYKRILANQEMRSLFGDAASLQAYVLKATQEEIYKKSVFERARPRTRLQSGAVPRVPKYTQARLISALDALSPPSTLY